LSFAAALLASTSAGNLASAATAINVQGSVALLPFVSAAAAAYQAKVSGVTIAVTPSSSKAALGQALTGGADVAMSDVAADDTPALLEHKIAVIAFAVVVNPSAGVTGLTKAQLRDVLSGKVANWKEVGGSDSKVVLINRLRTSGVRRVVGRAILGKLPFAESGILEDAAPAALADVKAVPGALSYVTTIDAQDQSGVVTLALDGVTPAAENVAAGSYPIWAYERLYTNGPPSIDVSRFIAFVESDSVLLHQFGLIPMRDMRPGAVAP
jgi:phosphate transport system substrate-binding protein